MKDSSSKEEGALYNPLCNLDDKGTCKKRKMYEDDISNDINEENNNFNRKKQRKDIKNIRQIMNIFNDIFNWIVSKGMNKIPCREIENINDVDFFNFNNVLSKHYGSKIIFVTDDSISNSENILGDDDKVGWITRRRRDVGHEWLIIKLKHPCIIYGIELNFDNIAEDVCPHLSIEVSDNNAIDDIIKEEEFILNERDNVDNFTIFTRNEIEDKVSDNIKMEKNKDMENIKNLEILKDTENIKNDQIIECVDNSKNMHWTQTIVNYEKEPIRKSYNFLDSYKIDKSISDLLEEQNTPWVELLQADCVDFLKTVGKKKTYYFKINNEDLIKKPWSHIRVNLYPDGGINKINFYGEFISLFKKHTIISKQKIFLNKPENGCTLIYYHCDHIYKGHPKYIIDSCKTDGFCTKRLINRPPIILRNLTNNCILNSSIFKFGVRGIVENFTIDIGNYIYDHPECIQIYLLDCIDILTLNLLEQKKIFEEDEKLLKKKIEWIQLPPFKIKTNEKKTFFHFNLLEYNFTIMERTATHFKISIHPDGGISQINVIGTVLSTYL
ncbi:allantoicase, putative [Plasmodium sp. gorilla clade G3]|nr:allantoicase, putative [Plasmodium sp. gorilla clade G3]